MVRMANALVECGRRVVVLSPDGPMRRHLSPAVEYRDSEGRPLGADFQPSRRGEEVRIWSSLPSFLSDGWSLQKRLWDEWRAPSRMVAGVFHPRQWYHDGRFSRSWLKGRANQALVEKGSLYFMNDATLSAHVKHWGPHLERCPVFRLHLADANTPRWTPRPGTTLRICSVGRIVPFKNYNYDAAEALQALLSEGIAVEWDIFGDGPDRPALEAKAGSLQLPLRFAGEVAYDQLQATMLGYDLFVGMGTAALEAAQTGMPTILALSDVPRGTYGFLDEAPSDSVAELVEGHAPRDLLADLRRFAGLTTAERIVLGQRCARSAEERSGGERAPFDKMFEAARPCPAPFPVRVRAEILLALQGRRDRHAP
jgi:hypothetical protein